MALRICVICSEPFDARRNTKSCSKECASKLRKAKRVAYNSSPEGKAKQAAYNSSPKGKAKKAAYNSSPKGKAKRAAYSSSPEGKAKKAAHNSSPKGKAKKAALYRNVLLPRRTKGKSLIVLLQARVAVQHLSKKKGKKQ